MKIIFQNIEEHFLFPSTLIASKTQQEVLTILGSCVAVCLYDERMRWGGINHYMLPWWDGKGVPSPKYGDVAIERLVEKMIMMGSQKHNLIAKVFGGASQHLAGESGMQIGSRNVVTAEKILGSIGINIVAKNVGGKRGRRIVFHSGTGQVFMKYLDGLK